MPRNLASANAYMVGGAHYRKGFQHWDFVAETQMGYFEGQISKYVTRHRTKKGREDLEKALHFTQKLMELVRLGKTPQVIRPGTDTVMRYGHENQLNALELHVISLLVRWRDVNDLQNAHAAISTLLFNHYGEAEPPGSPGPAYVNQ